jgi:hypothetical protein
MAGATPATRRSGCQGGPRAWCCRTRTRGTVTATSTPRSGSRHQKRSHSHMPCSELTLFAAVTRRNGSRCLAATWRQRRKTARRGCSWTWNQCRLSANGTTSATTARRREAGPCPRASRRGPGSRTASRSPARGSSLRLPALRGPRSPDPTRWRRRRRAHPSARGPRTTMK